MNFSPVQNFIARKAAQILADKLETKVSLQHVRIDFLNHVVIQGLYVEGKQDKDTLAYVGEARVRITDWFFLKKGVPVLKYIGLKNTYAHLYRKHESDVWNYQFIVDAFDTGPSPKKKKKQQQNFEIDLEKVALENVRFHMDDAWVGTDMDFDVGDALIAADEVNLKKKLVLLDKIELGKLVIQYNDYDGGRPPRPKKPHVIDSTPFNPDKWIIKLSTLKLDDCYFGFEASPTPAIAGEFDASHMKISGINVNVSDISIDGDTLKGNIKNMSAKERCGLTVKKFKAIVSVSPNASICKNLLLQTEHSKIENYYAMYYTRFPDFNDYIHKVLMLANFKNTVIDSRDIAVFAPVLRQYPTIVNVSGKVKARVDNIQAQNLHLTDGISTIKGNLIMKGLPDINTTFIDYQNGELMTGAKGILKYAPSLRNNKDIAIDKLSMIYFKGNFTGYISNFASNSVLVTNLGTIRSNIKMNLPGMKGNAAKYSGTIATEAFNIGTLLNQNDLGSVTMNAKISGSSFDPKTATVDVHAVINRFDYKQYPYKNVSLDGAIKKNKFDGNLLIDDPNLAMAFYGSIDFSAQQVRVNAKANLLKSNLTALNFVKDSITATADFDLDCVGSDIDNFSGYAKLYNINVERNHHRLDLDSIYINSSINEGTKLLIIESNAITAKVRGDYKLSKIGNSAQYYIAGYLPSYINLPKGEAPAQRLTFEVVTKEIDSLLGIVIPNIKGFNGAVIKGSLNTIEQSFLLEGNIPYGKINNIRISDVAINGNGNFQKLTLTGNVRQVVIGDSALTGSIKLNTSLGNNKLDFNIATSTADRYGTANLTGHAIANGDSMNVVLQPSEFYLNNTKWDIKAASFTLADKYLFVKNIILNSDNQRIVAYSSTDDISGKSTLHADISNIDISHIAGIAGLSDLQASGYINGNIAAKDILGKMSVTADIKAENVKFGNDTLGNVNIAGSYDDTRKIINLNDKSGVYRGLASLTASGSMSFDSSNRENLSGKISMNNAPLGWLNPVLLGYVSNISGTLNGDININGSAVSPDVEGYIKLNNAGMRIDFLGPYYKINQAYIKVNNTKIDIGDFVLFDVNDNSATLTGGITHDRFKNMKLDLRMTSSKIQVINLREDENDIFYGNLTASIERMRIRGPFNDITIDIRKAQPFDKSHLYLPMSSGNGLGTYSYVTFKDYGQKPKQVKRKEKNKLSISIDAVMTPDCEISLVLDPASGDAINAKGNGRITMDMPSGNELRMNGKYTVKEGDYTFTIKDLFFKRNFKLDAGSTIFFNGPIDKTLLDVQGIYSTRAKLFDLLSNSEKNILQNKGNENEFKEARVQQQVDIRLFMKGSMGSPQLTFKLELPDKRTSGTTTSNRLQIVNSEDKELNKQVASLLLFGSFAPGDIGGGGAATTGSISSISQMISGQLSNQLSNVLSKLTGDESLRIDLNYATYGDAASSTGARNEVSFGLKKNLFRNALNDRLELQVGSKYDWGKTASTSSSNFNPVGDFRLQYLFRDGGSMRGYLFRTSSYDIIDNRNISRGGIGLSWSKSFNKLTDLFRSRKYLNRKREEEEKAYRDRGASNANENDNGNGNGNE